MPSNLTKPHPAICDDNDVGNIPNGHLINRALCWQNKFQEMNQFVMSIDSEQARMYVAATVYYPKLMDARLHNMPHSNERTESTQQMSRT